MGGRHASEWVDGMRRNPQVVWARLLPCAGAVDRMVPAAAASPACILARFQSRCPSGLEVAGIPREIF